MAKSALTTRIAVAAGFVLCALGATVVLLGWDVALCETPRPGSARADYCEWFGEGGLWISALAPFAIIAVALTPLRTAWVVGAGLAVLAVDAILAAPLIL